MRRLVLASSSKPRKALLERLKIPFECANPDLDETPLANEAPDVMVLRLAKEKAAIVSDQFSDSLIIGADQVGVIDNQVLGKPLTHENAIRQLFAMSGKTLQFMTGLCLLDTRTGEHQLTLERNSLTFRHLTPEIIARYLQKEEVLQCAGSFRLEGLGIALIDSIQGDDYTGITGLPLMQLVKMLESAGYPVP